VIQDIRKINYVTFRVSISKCKWVDHNTGIRTDDYEFTLVDLNKMGYKNESFTMTHQARKIFYFNIDLMRNAMWFWREEACTTLT